MASKLAKVKNSILVLLSDGKEHCSDEMRDFIQEEGIDLDKNSSALRTAYESTSTSSFTGLYNSNVTTS